MSLFHAGVIPALDSNGQPVSGARWQFTATGTTTALPVYSDDLLDTSLGSYVESNAAGRFPNVYFNDNLSYRARLWPDSTMTGTPIKDLDPANPGSNVRISVLQYGAVGDGETDDTDAVQATHDALPNGGTIFFPRADAPYRVSTVDITNRNIRVLLDAGATIQKFGAGGGIERGVFRVQNLLNANFLLEGAGKGLSFIDLNDEGPMEIGVEGRNPNTYGPQNGGVIGIDGIGNAAVFGLRSSHITVYGLSIENTCESCVMFRNCGDTLVEQCFMRNAAHFGVEWSLVTAGVDGGTGTMPDRSRQYVTNCDFEDMPDFALGGGNGVAVGGGGEPESEAFNDYRVLDCTMRRCQRDVHLEFHGGGWIDGMEIRYLSRNALQGSLGLVNVRKYNVRMQALDPGAGPTAAGLVGSDFVDIYGMVVSSAEADRGYADVQIIDRRNSRNYYGSDGAMASGSAVFTSATASFETTAAEGDPFAVAEAGPDGAALVTTIVSVDSDTQVTLALPNLSGGAVSGSQYGHGGATRFGVLLNQGGDLKLTGLIEAGVDSGIADHLFDVSGVPTLRSEPAAAALQIATNVFGRIETDGLSIVAPATSGGTTPAGLRLLGNLTGSGRLDTRGVAIRGFTEQFVGVDAYRADCIGPCSQTAAGVFVSPSASSGTYGTEAFLDPHGDWFGHFLGGGLIFDLPAAQTVTVRITAYRFDGNSNTFDIQSNTDGETKDISQFGLWSLNQDNAPLKRIGVKVQSTIGSSTARAFYFFRAMEG